MVPSPDAAISDLSRQLGDRLAAAAISVITVESCTGGWVAKAITDVAGSSDWFEAGLITYSNAAKQQLVGVGADTLAEHGAVSAATVAAMASGALARWEGATLSVAVSGVAGPGGGSAEKPVGLVWFAWADRRRGVHVPPDTQYRHFPGDRAAVRAASVAHALGGLLERV